MRFYTIFLLLLCASISFSQKEIILNINHQLSGNDFQIGMADKNNLDHEFIIERLEYYISGIKLYDNNGDELDLPDIYLLANGQRSTSLSLGEHNFNNITKIQLSIGVDEDNNHGDPSSWPSSHPLAPKFPSMHWGWAAGYRFIAIEGKSGSNLNTTWQLHGLGDNNYFNTTINITPREENDKTYIDLNADYTKSLFDIDLEVGPISHGEVGAAKDCLVNFNRNVFTDANALSSNNDIEFQSFNIYPNPTNQSNINLEFDTYEALRTVRIYNINGQLIQENAIPRKLNRISIEDSGTYLLNIIANNNYKSQRLIIE